MYPQVESQSARVLHHPRATYVRHSLLPRPISKAKIAYSPTPWWIIFERILVRRIQMGFLLALHSDFGRAEGSLT